jgi:hypothetical protein
MVVNGWPKGYKGASNHGIFAFNTKLLPWIFASEFFCHMVTNENLVQFIQGILMKKMSQSH